MLLIVSCVISCVIFGFLLFWTALLISRNYKPPCSAFGNAIEPSCPIHQGHEAGKTHFNQWTDKRLHAQNTSVHWFEVKFRGKKTEIRVFAFFATAAPTFHDFVFWKQNGCSLLLLRLLIFSLHSWKVKV